MQVEGMVNEDALNELRQGVQLNDGLTKPAQARKINSPKLWPREKPIRERLNTPTNWIEITIAEGKNRQIRRMTASVGLPTLRLIRASIGNWHINDLLPGQYLETQIHMPTPNKNLKNKKQRINNRGITR